MQQSLQTAGHTESLCCIIIDGPKHATKAVEKLINGAACSGPASSGLVSNWKLTDKNGFKAYLSLGYFYCLPWQWRLMTIDGRELF